MQEMKPSVLILLTLHFYTITMLVRHAMTNGKTVLYTGNISWLCSQKLQVLVSNVNNHPCAGYIGLNFDYLNKKCWTLRSPI